jgi:hypothetical protein
MPKLFHLRTIHSIMSLEMKRVARKTVFLGDLRTVGHPHKQQKHVMEGTIQHTLFQKTDLSAMGFVVSDEIWGGDTRFNAVYRPVVTTSGACSVVKNGTTKSK